MKRLILEINGRKLKNGEEICLVNKKILKYNKLNEFNNDTLIKYCDWNSDCYYPTEISAGLVGADWGDKLILEREGLHREYSVQGGRALITNMIPGKKYCVYAEDKDGNKLSGKIYFTTSPDAPRMLRIHSVGNTRDMGGTVSADGRYRFMYGKVYRGDGLKNISDAGLRTLKDELGVRTEIDVTGGGETCEKLEKELNVIKQGIWWYNNIFDHPDDYPNLARVIRIFADKDNYPVYFHCSLGRDRTGTVAFILKGLCGISETEIRREHFYSFFSLRGNRENVPIYAHLGNIIALTERMMAFAPEGGNLNDAIYAFTKHIGLTDEEIQSIRDNLLEKI